MVEGWSGFGRSVVVATPLYLYVILMVSYYHPITILLLSIYLPDGFRSLDAGLWVRSPSTRYGRIFKDDSS